MSDRLSKILTILLATLPTIIWLCLNTSYPMSDGGDFIMPTYRAYIRWDEGRYGQALINLYLWRPWKPVMFSVFAFPALVVTQGDVRVACALTLIFIQAGLAAYVFSFIRLRQTQIFTAVATVVVMTFSFVILNGVRYFAESSLCLAAVALAYHVFKASRSWHQKHLIMTFFCLSIALLVRPIEGTLTILGPLAVLLYQAYAQKKICGRTLIVWASLVFLELGYIVFDLIALMRGQDYIGFSPLAIIALVCPLLLFFGAFISWFRQRENIIALLGSMSFLTLSFWYVPYVRILNHWIYACTFGELTVRTGNRELGTWHFYETLSREGGWVLIALFGCFLFWREKNKNEDRLLLWLFLPSIILTFAMGLPLQNSDHRYYLAATMMLQVLVASLMPNLRCRLRWMLAAVAVFGLVMNLNTFIASVVAGTGDNYWSGWFGQIRHVDRGADINLLMDTEVANHIPVNTSVKPLVGIIGLGKPTDAENQRLTNPWALAIVSLEKRRGYEYRLETGYEKLTIEEGFKRLRCRRDYIYIGPVGGNINNKWSTAAKFGVMIVDGWRKNELLRLGFSSASEVRPVGIDAHYLLVKTIRPKDCDGQKKLVYALGIFD